MAEKDDVIRKIKKLMALAEDTYSKRPRDTTCYISCK